MTEWTEHTFLHSAYDNRGKQIITMSRHTGTYPNHVASSLCFSREEALQVCEVLSRMLAEEANPEEVAA